MNASPSTGPDPTPATMFRVDGMNCANCVRHVTEAMQGVADVATAIVSLEDGRATVRWREGVAPAAAAIVEAVRRAGYSAQALEPDETGAPTRAGALAAWRFTVIFSALLTVPLILGEWVLGLGGVAWFHWLGFALATPVLVVGGGRFYRGAWQQLKRGASSMDTLVALGSSAAYGFSLWALISGWTGHLYFMEAGAIITLISAGHWLEALAGARAADALRALMRLAPDRARRLDQAGREESVPAEALRQDDRITLKPGDRVPVDAVVVEGDSVADESMLTGESLPVNKGPGSVVYAGTLNVDGRLIARVTATGQATALAQIIAAVERAQNSRANIQRLADRISNIFVPAVIGVALFTALAWAFAYDQTRGLAEALMPGLWPIHLPVSPLAAAFIHAAAVLIVACPCAMGLATPAAIMAGANAAARRGILIRDGVALEKSGQITTLVFDKTGTLTRGQMSLAAHHILDARDPAAPSALAYAAAIARPSAHPVSRAVASSATENPAEPIWANWREHRGSGVEAIDGATGSVWRLGSLVWLETCDVGLERGQAFIRRWTGLGATVLGLSCDRQLAGLFAVRDELKPAARAVVSDLMGQGQAVYLVTGDAPLTAVAVAEAAGIPPQNVRAGVRPERKADLVKELQTGGQRVAFIGDGINDAPALEQADLGIAVSQASDVAREAADIILLKSDIHAIPEALGLARATLRTIRQNLFWAFFYNAAAVPLAALGFLSPVLCALAMGVSDLVVIGNAFRLRRYRAPRSKTAVNGLPS